MTLHFIRDVSAILKYVLRKLNNFTWIELNWIEYILPGYQERKLLSVSLHFFLSVCNLLSEF